MESGLMNEPTSAEYVNRLLEIAITDTASSSVLSDLHRKLVQAREQMRQPMRVAVVGLIKAGKSTAVNALLSEDVVATGTIETTFNVNWLRYAEKKSLLVHFKDNHPVESRSFEDLSSLTKRDKEHLEFLRSIKYIQVLYPNDILRTLDLIDTPGLKSVYGDDSQNALDIINAHEMTKEEASKADAVLYLFSQSISASGQSVIEEFQGPLMGVVTPIKSIGVLTIVDVYWPDVQDPIETGYKVIRRLQRDHPQLQRLLYAILPISGLLALGAQTLTPQEFETLIEMARIPEAAFKRRLKYADDFAKERFEDVPIAPEHRQQVLRRLGQYGIWRAYQHIHTGISGYQQLKSVLLEESGVPQLRDLILSHFGNRAFLIKLDEVLREIARASFTVRSRAQGRDLEILKNVTRTFEELVTQQEGLSELRVLRSYYEGNLSLNTEEVQQLLQITGEHGTAYWQRLGMAGEENIATEARLERSLTAALQTARYWRYRAINPSTDGATSDAAKVLARGYERLAFHIREAMQHLNLSM